MRLRSKGNPVLKKKLSLDKGKKGGKMIKEKWKRGVMLSLKINSS